MIQIKVALDLAVPTLSDIQLELLDIVAREARHVQIVRRVQVDIARSLNVHVQLQVTLVNTLAIVDLNNAYVKLKGFPTKREKKGPNLKPIILAIGHQNRLSIAINMDSRGLIHLTFGLTKVTKGQLHVPLETRLVNNASSQIGHVQMILADAHEAELCFIKAMQIALLNQQSPIK